MLRIFPRWQRVITETTVFYFVYTNKEADESASKNVSPYGYVNIKHRASLLANFHFTVFTQYCQLCSHTT
jgi:hypothetical protein